MKCPVCGSTARIQRTNVITKYLRDLVHCCNNPQCAHIYVTQQEFIRTVMPSKLDEQNESLDIDDSADDDANGTFTVT